MSLDPLAQLNLVTILALIAIVAGTLLVLRRIFFLPLLRVMEARAARIESARTRRAESAALLAAAEAERDRILSAAQAEAERLAEAARSEAATARAARLAKAGTEADAILARGRGEVDALRQAEEARLAEELVACVVRALGEMKVQAEEPAIRLLVTRALTSSRTG